VLQEGKPHRARVGVGRARSKEGYDSWMKHEERRTPPVPGIKEERNRKRTDRMKND